MFPKEARKSLKEARKCLKEARKKKGTSFNVFSMFKQSQIQEFKQCFWFRNSNSVFGSLKQRPL